MIKAGNIGMQRHTNKTLKSRRVLYVIKDHKMQLCWRQKTSQKCKFKCTTKLRHISA